MPELLTRKESIEALRCCARIEDYSCHGCPCLDSDGVCTCDNFIEIPQALITAAIDLLVDGVDSSQSRINFQG